MIKTVNKRIESTITLELDKEELIRLLFIDGNYIPTDAEITVTMPSGGDYSGDNIVMGDDFNHISIVYRKIEEEKE